jgi:galactokinase
MALLRYSGATLTSKEIVALCRRAENEYVGSPCGIMDQFVITYAKRGHALLLNTRDLTYQHLPLNRGPLAECVIVVANSGVRHSIAGTSYGLRRRELEVGQDVLLDRYPELRDLGDASLSQLASCESLLPPESYRRCRHVISENSRTLQASSAMLSGNPNLLGTLMTQAHQSERDDFECSTAEIDFLVSTAIELPGCYGARLTGGGFGGCTVNLVKAAEAKAFNSSLSAAYRKRWGYDLSIYVCEAADGAMARAEAE